ncbi:MAG: hypothetical protein A2042_01330 [Candidatus Schekmanbacteria bacterium GWA2_38_11]|uniref:Uncharacterized protein n=1 Tax=Candidatus Schekmanbacteria bacterium GWA2_38_11 TaxID=1817876 RepID=A0A1F7RAX0_9BACT|nr:MAG: hypothetical protein A2042_01330 [Candidatus Schekmanbacteria bacterium GWA2_38_11]
MAFNTVLVYHRILKGLSCDQYLPPLLACLQAGKSKVERKHLSKREKIADNLNLIAYPLVEQSQKKVEPANLHFGKYAYDINHTNKNCKL